MHSQSSQISKSFVVRIAVIVLGAVLILAALPGRVMAQQNAASSPVSSAATANSVPQIIEFSGQFSGQFSGTQGGGGSAAVPAGTVSVTFTLYENEQGGTALWSETQNVQVDAQGHYTALLGSASPEGLPMNLFTTAQAHWLAVQTLSEGFGEQPRVLLVSAPYALKAGDAETIGGLPPSAFVRVDASSGASGTIAGTSVGTMTAATTASKGSAHANPVRLTTTECGDFCDATTGYQISGTTVVQTPGGLGSENTALGVSALLSATGGGNTATGHGALMSNTTGIQNTATGDDVLIDNTTGSNNTASGLDALAFNTTGNNNTATGASALLANTTGGNNTASGNQALFNNSKGFNNTASGFQALESNTTGSDNTASGDAALFSNTIGSANMASGEDALKLNTKGTDNTASGEAALFNNTTGNDNTASGFSALAFNTTGSNDIAIGFQAANNVSGGNSNNIHIGSAGSSTDNSLIRIGTKGTQKKFFVAGVSGVTTGQNNAVPVLIDSNGQLGTVSSSRRFKEDIHDMGGASQGLMRLRPVTFRYKKPFDDGTKPIQYGLIAEEVAEVYPDLVARSADGQIETVKYQLLDPMLLNEVQRQHAETQLQQAGIRDLQERLKAQHALVVAQQNQIKAQQAQIRDLASQMKTIQASLRTRPGSSHAQLASAPIHTEAGQPAPATTGASLPVASAARGGN
jgi:hypothetical protein